MKPTIASLIFAFVSCAASVVAQTPLPIPPALLPVYDESGVATYEIVAGYGSRVFLESFETSTMGYSGDFLGPTLRLSVGDAVAISVRNDLDEATTAHWHGLHVPAESDGGPHQMIEPGEVWTARFTVRQQSATLWYHPHPIGETGAQVYAGLAGLLIIDDGASDSLGLPSDYGVDDIPLIIADRRFTRNGEFAYARGMPDVMQGVAGEVMLVNGVADPVLTVARGVVRLRVLNGSDSSVYRLRFADGTSFRQIASDGGYLEAPYESAQVVFGTGERVELLLDTSAYEGSELLLLVDDHFGQTFEAMTIAIDERLVAGVVSLDEVSPRLNRIERPALARGVETREFVMQTMGPGGQLTINGKQMDMTRIDARIPLGKSEIWEVSNQAMGMMAFPHIFHLHEGQYLVIDVNGEPPPPSLAGWKDSFLLWPSDTIRIAVRYEEYTGLYMYHCHFLVHEDAGMMGQFEIYAE